MSFSFTPPLRTAPSTPEVLKASAFWAGVSFISAPSSGLKITARRSRGKERKERKNTQGVRNV